MDIIDFTLSMCTTIYKLVDNVKSNKERCQRVAQRVKGLEELVNTIKQRGPSQISVTVDNALKELCTTLESAKELMTKYSQTKPVMNILKSSSREDKFREINERLTDNFQVLSGALQIEHGNVLFKVFQTVAGRSLDEESYSEQASSTIYTAPMAASSPTAPMPASSPTAPMPPMAASSPTAPMAASSPTAPMAASSPTAPMTASSPTAPMAASSTTAPMPPMTVSSPTAPMPMPMSIPSAPLYPVLQMSNPTAPLLPILPMSGHTTPMPRPSIMPPTPVSAPTAPMPVRCITSPMQMCSPTAVMPLTGTMNSALYSTNMVSNHIYATVSSSTTMAPKPVVKAIAPTRAPVVRTYMLNNSYYR